MKSILGALIVLAVVGFLPCVAQADEFEWFPDSGIPDPLKLTLKLNPETGLVAEASLNFQAMLCSRTVPVAIRPDAIVDHWIDWSWLGNWDNPSLAGYVVFDIVKTVEFQSLSVSTYLNLFKPLEDTGPSEKTLSVGIGLNKILKLAYPALPDEEVDRAITQFDLKASLAARLQYDVTIPTGAKVVMNQEPMTLQSLHIESNAAVFGRPSMVIRKDLVNEGEFTNAAGLVEGSLFNGSLGAINIAPNSSFTITGSLISNPGGYIQLGTGSVLTLKTEDGTVNNSGKIVLAGQSLQVGSGRWTGAGEVLLGGGTATGLEADTVVTMDAPDAVAGTGTLNWNLSGSLCNDTIGDAWTLQGSVISSGAYIASNGASFLVSSSGLTNEGTITLHGQGTQMTTQYTTGPYQTFTADLLGSGRVAIEDGAVFDMIAGIWCNIRGDHWESRARVYNDIEVTSGGTLRTSGYTWGAGAGNEICGNVDNSGLIAIDTWTDMKSSLINRGRVRVSNVLNFAPGSHVDGDGWFEGSGSIIGTVDGRVNLSGTDSTLAFAGTVLPGGTVMVSDRATLFVTTMTNEGTITLRGQGTQMATQYTTGPQTFTADLLGSGRVAIEDGAVFDMIAGIWSNVRGDHWESRARVYNDIEVAPGGTLRTSGMVCGETLGHELWGSVVNRGLIEVNADCDLRGQLVNDGMINVVKKLRLTDELVEGNGEISMQGGTVSSSQMISFTNPNQVKGTGLLVLSLSGALVNDVPGDRWTLDGKVLSTGNYIASNGAGFLLSSNLTNEGTITLRGQGTQMTTQYTTGPYQTFTADLLGSGRVAIEDGAVFDMIAGIWCNVRGDHWESRVRVYNDIEVASGGTLRASGSTLGEGAGHELWGCVTNRGRIEVNCDLDIYGDIANFGDIVASRPVRFHGDFINNGNLVTPGLTKSGTDTVTLAGADKVTGPITIAAGELQISVLNEAANSQVSVSAGASLLAQRIQGNSLTVNGLVTIRPRELDSTVSVFSAANNLTIGAAGTLDLKDNDMIIKGGSLATVQAQIKSAYAGGTWAGYGITTTTGVAGQGLGVDTAGNLGLTSFAGQTVAAGDVLVKYTWMGDADFNGIVNFSDFLKLQAGYGKSAQTWANGDFNYDGSVNFSDFLLLQAAYGKPAPQVIVASGDSLLADRVQGNSLMVNGLVTIRPSGLDMNVSIFDAAHTLTFGATGKFDLKNNDMIVKGGSLSAIQAQIKSAYAGGTWTGCGITTTTGAAGTGLGVDTAGNLGLTTFAGQTVAAADVVVKYTWMGDADFNGVVNFSDFLKLQAGYGKTNQAWANGDFNYDGSVNFSDFLLLQAAYGKPALSETMDPISVPEPATLVLLALGGLALLRRRRTERQRKVNHVHRTYQAK